MIVEFNENFDKDLVKIEKKLLKRLFIKISLFEKCKNINEISGIKKLKWFDTFYRIRIWDYRIWFSMSAWKIVLERFLHRKDIYRYYPK